MQQGDLALQVIVFSPYAEGQDVVFVGDSDCTCLLLGLLAAAGGPSPARMVLIDFDKRLLRVATDFAKSHGFSHLLSAYPYNVFEPIPEAIAGSFDWFYTNPPYGSRNQGLSARLFLNRGIELTRPGAGHGCAILPYDSSRPWTEVAWFQTEGFLHRRGWVVREMIDQMHQYHLDDDQELASSLILVDRIGAIDDRDPTEFDRRSVSFSEIPQFYGTTVCPPYPRYIELDGTFDFAWPDAPGT